MNFFSLSITMYSFQFLLHQCNDALLMLNGASWSEGELILARHILTFKGSYVPVRQMQQCHHGSKELRKMSGILSVMHRLSAPEPNHYGTVVYLGHKSKVFYKCPPCFLHALANFRLFGLTRDVYASSFEAQQKPWSRSNLPSLEFKLLLQSSSPYYADAAAQDDTVASTQRCIDRN